MVRRMLNEWKIAEPLDLIWQAEAFWHEAEAYVAIGLVLHEEYQHIIAH